MTSLDAPGLQGRGTRALPVTGQLTLAVGQHSDKGRKALNQDYCAGRIPREPQLTLKGAAFAVADGISTSSVSRIASETAVTSFLDDYFCTCDAWSVRQSAERVLQATNAWLHDQTHSGPLRHEPDKGYVCTFSALVFKAARAYLFHVGDSRVYRLRGERLEQLSHDHRVLISRQQSYLSRALGAEAQLEIDHQALPLEVGDIFILATDGVYEHLDAQAISRTVNEGLSDLDATARRLVQQAWDGQSPDNLTVQIVRVVALPDAGPARLQQQAEALPLPPIPQPRDTLDGYLIVRGLHASHRSHVYLAQDPETRARVVLKIPAIDRRDEPEYLERLLMEEWIARRVNSAHVLKAAPPVRPRRYLYTAMEYLEGQTLGQWLIDHPQPDLEQVRRLIEQVARGLQALHRAEVLHQDIRPENLMIDATGTVKIIDFGAARVAGVTEAAVPLSPGAEAEPEPVPGTLLYTAPEYFLGEGGDARGDLYSLGVLTYHLLSGRFPYGNRVAQCRTRADQRRLRYCSVLDDEREIPAWVDHTLRKAVHPDPHRRYGELSEFIFDLRHPNPAFASRERAPLIERHPVRVWQGIAGVLAAIIVYLLSR